MDYRESINRLLSLVDHERRQPVAPRQKQIFDLGRMDRFLELLGNPHRSTPAIHVAGTKGKGSTAAFCDSVLAAAGYRTGFYSSPHLHSFCERIRRDTAPISQPRFASLVQELWPFQERIGRSAQLGEVSLFEFMTAMAFWCFSEDRVDFQTIEVGLGGRLDATNVVDPEVAIITSISLDHTGILGDSLEQIAAEKAGIIKSQVPVVIAPQPPQALEVILSKCREQRAIPIRLPEDVNWNLEEHSIDRQSLRVRGRLGEYSLQIPLLGTHQLENASSALAALEILMEKGYAIPQDAIKQGFATASWPCRMEVLATKPLLLADGAHNAHSIGVLLRSLPEYFSYRRIALIVGFSRDKQISEMVNLLAQQGTTVYATRSRHPRSVPPDEVGELFRDRGTASVAEIETVEEAVSLARQAAGPDDLILGIGSLFVAAEIREAVLGIEPELYPDLLPAGKRPAG